MPAPAPPGTAAATAGAPGRGASPAPRSSPRAVRDHPQHVLQRLTDGMAVRVDHDRIGGGLQWRDDSLAVELVAPQDLVQQVLARPHVAARGELLSPAPGALVRG